MSLHSVLRINEVGIVARRAGKAPSHVRIRADWISADDCARCPGWCQAIKQGEQAGRGPPEEVAREGVSQSARLGGTNLRRSAFCREPKRAALRTVLYMVVPERWAPENDIGLAG